MSTRIVNGLRGAAVAAAVVLLGACGTAVGNPGNASAIPAPAPDVHQLYARALQDAAIYEERDVARLYPATPGADGRVRVVTLESVAWAVGDTAFDGTDVWVTVVPEVRDSCDDWAAREQVMRLRQLLGLQPGYPAAYFMEISVAPEGLFRPTANPAIQTDTLCTPAVAGAGCALAFPEGVDPRHFRWMVNQAFSSWKMPDGYPAANTVKAQQLGYPWTRLGYTYNWHPGSPRYGASEYVIRAGTRFTITRVSTVAEYCGA